jgi:hypothetical protein
VATNLKKLLFVDTNIWLDFYRARNEAYIGLLDRLEDIASKIIVTHQLETEYKANRQAAILEGMSVLKTPAPIPSVGVLSNAKAFEMLGKGLKKAQNRVKGLEEKLIRLLAKPAESDPVYKVCQRIFHKEDALVLTRSDPRRKIVRNRAHRRFLHGCPPRKRNDTAYGDAINWEWMIECAINQNAELVIVSRDHDYGVTYKGVSYVNDHLKQEFSNRVSQKRQLLLYTKVSDALKHFHVAVTKEQVDAEKELLHAEPMTVATPDDFDDLTQ